MTPETLCSHGIETPQREAVLCCPYKVECGCPLTEKLRQTSQPSSSWQPVRGQKMHLDDGVQTRTGGSRAGSPVPTMMLVKCALSQVNVPVSAARLLLAKTTAGGASGTISLPGVCEEGTAATAPLNTLLHSPPPTPIFLSVEISISENSSGADTLGNPTK